MLPSTGDSSLQCRWEEILLQEKVSLPIPGKKKPYKTSSDCIETVDPRHELWKVGVVWLNARVSSRSSRDDFRVFLPFKCQQRNIFIT